MIISIIYQIQIRDHNGYTQKQKEKEKGRRNNRR